MKNYWINKIYGLVEVEMSKREKNGESPTRIVNLLSRNGIELFDIQYDSESKIIFTINVKMIRKMRKIVRGKGVKIKFKKRLGLNFTVFKYISRKGLVIGTLGSIVIIFLLSNVVWRIEVVGASPGVEKQIREELSELGIKRWRFNFNSETPDEIQKALTNNIPEVTWIGVESLGSTYQLQVVEKLVQEETRENKHPQLIATKKGIIVRSFLDSGQAVVEPNQVVQKGQQLASGYIGKEDNLAYVGASGEVWALTWYTVTSEVPIKNTVEKQTGERHTRIELQLGNNSIPIFGFNEPDYKSSTVEESEFNFKFLKWEFPVSINKTLTKETIVKERVLPEKDAEAIALENARTDMMSNVSPDSEIKEENILRKSITSDKVVLTIHYEVLENIATGAEMPDPTLPISN